MKSFLTFAVVCFLLALSAVESFATPYLRLLDLNHSSVSGEVLFDPNQGIDATQLGTFLAVITHSPSDGCILPKVVCESWSPLEVGGTFTGTNKMFGLGPQANLLPWMKAGALALVNGVTPANSLTGLKTFLGSSYTSNFSFSIGTKWLIAPDQNWKGYFLLSGGPTLTW